MASDAQKSGGSGGKPSGSGTGPTAKQLAAQARAEAEAAEKRRERTVRIIGALVVLIVVAGLLTVGLLAKKGGDTGSSSTPAAAPSPDANAPLPSAVQTSTYGWPFGAGWMAKNEAKLPTLELWEDFQCPGCKALENAAGAKIEALATAGIVKLLYRPATFLDNNSALKIPNSSARATAAWGCAIDAGKGSEYHSTVFANQPEEGDGYSDETLIGFASQAGISGDALTTFTTCFTDGKYLSWAANSNQAFTQAGIGGTPTGVLNGVQLSGSDLADIEGLKAKIAAATAK